MTDGEVEVEWDARLEEYYKSVNPEKEAANNLEPKPAVMASTPRETK